MTVDIGMNYSCGYCARTPVNLRETEQNTSLKSPSNKLVKNIEKGSSEVSFFSPQMPLDFSDILNVS